MWDGYKEITESGICHSEQREESYEVISFKQILRLRSE